VDEKYNGGKGVACDRGGTLRRQGKGAGSLGGTIGTETVVRAVGCNIKKKKMKAFLGATASENVANKKGKREKK